MGSGGKVDAVGSEILAAASLRSEMWCCGDHWVVQFLFPGMILAWGCAEIFWEWG